MELMSRIIVVLAGKYCCMAFSIFIFIIFILSNISLLILLFSIFTGLTIFFF